MAGSNGQRAQRMRRQESKRGESTFDATVTVIGQGRDGNTPYISPTQIGAEVAGIEIGDEVTISVFEDSVVIHTDE